MLGRTSGCSSPEGVDACVMGAPGSPGSFHGERGPLAALPREEAQRDEEHQRLGQGEALDGGVSLNT
ncbi:hypothetical protein F0U61_11900 [Archangium violaceum]|uniref:hypothetical protein n=1 Tax=Archangium violaceum TaxID=83451 RepID=UPI002B31FBBA|nr:hypothetical protein F0U61_11900 [Archangium violaceum]